MPPIRMARRRRKLRLARAPTSAMRRIRRKVYGGKVHAFTEKCQLASIGVAGGTTSFTTQTYKLSDLLNSPSFAAMFDLYKLKGVKLTLIPLVSNSESTFTNTAGQAGAAPMLYIAPNRDQFVPPPSTINDVINDDGCKIIRFLKPVSLYLSNPKPVITTPDSTLVPFQFNVKTQPWLTTGGNAQIVNQISVPHYGHRIAITNMASAELVVQVYAKYYFELKEQD